jgi:hypothetical protein
MCADETAFDMNGLDEVDDTLTELVLQLMAGMYAVCSDSCADEPIPTIDFDAALFAVEQQSIGKTNLDLITDRRVVPPLTLKICQATPPTKSWLKFDAKTMGDIHSMESRIIQETHSALVYDHIQLSIRAVVIKRSPQRPGTLYSTHQEHMKDGPTYDILRRNDGGQQCEHSPCYNLLDYGCFIRVLKNYKSMKTRGTIPRRQVVYIFNSGGVVEMGGISTRSIAYTKDATTWC